MSTNVAKATLDFFIVRDSSRKGLSMGDGSSKHCESGAKLMEDKLLSCSGKKSKYSKHFKCNDVSSEQQRKIISRGNLMDTRVLICKDVKADMNGRTRVNRSGSRVPMT